MRAEPARGLIQGTWHVRAIGTVQRVAKARRGPAARNTVCSAVHRAGTRTALSHRHRTMWQLFAACAEDRMRGDWKVLFETAWMRGGRWRARTGDRVARTAQAIATGKRETIVSAGRNRRGQNDRPSRYVCTRKRYGKTLRQHGTIITLIVRLAVPAPPPQHPRIPGRGIPVAPLKSPRQRCARLRRALCIRSSASGPIPSVADRSHACDLAVFIAGGS